MDGEGQSILDERVSRICGLNPSFMLLILNSVDFLENMKFLIRVDASYEIGIGHVMRCLTLANILREKGNDILFVCRRLQGHLIDNIKQLGFNVKTLGTGSKCALSLETEGKKYSEKYDFEQCRSSIVDFIPDWIVVDHYILGAEWEFSASQLDAKILVIDDLANKSHYCNCLLDQNIGREQDDYVGLVPDFCQVLVGPKFSLLRDEFRQWRCISLDRREKSKGQINRIMIGFGGVDKDNHTLQALNALAELSLKDVEINVVMGPAALHVETVKNRLSTFPHACRLMIGVSNIAEVMAYADLAIGAAGSTTWERCSLGLPAIQVIAADNQRAVAEYLAKENIVKMADEANVVADIKKHLVFLLTCPEEMIRMSTASAKITDGQGAPLVGNFLMELST